MTNVIVKYVLVIVVILASLLHQHARAKEGQFYGGSLSYKMEEKADGTNLVTIELITGWILGKGPCGPGCNSSDIGRSTRSTRSLMTRINSDYLGIYTSDFLNKTATKTETHDMNALVLSTYNETVIAISEPEKWEQELLHFSFLMPPGIEKLDVNFDGESWRNLTLQRGPGRWHLQTTVSTAVRSDTGKPNRSPRSFLRPFYRVKLGTVAKIHIPAVDDDGDFITCNKAAYVEGDYIAVYPPPNVLVFENCTVSINTSESSNYTDDSWIAMPVSVRDYNRKKIIDGTPYGILPYKFSLSATSVQFVVQVLANLITPKFVEPTFESNHIFIMYADTTLRTKIYVEAPENTTIESFSTLGIQHERFKLSPIQQDPRRPQVKYATMTWKPPAGEIGRHIVCANARDNTGVDSAQDRCFILDVKGDAFNYSTQALAGKPYFVDIPSLDQTVDCKIYSTCVIALYVKSTIEVVDVHVTVSFLDNFEFGPVRSVTHKGETMYQADLSFEHFMHGKEKICFVAIDKNGGESEIICIQCKIEPLDPCRFDPCQNSGTCVMDTDTGGFTCRCLPGLSGERCQFKEEKCTPDPCVQEHTVMCVDLAGVLCYCKPGFTGDTCDINIDDCHANACNGHGLCKDKVNGFDCECFSRYNGTKCEIDKCPTQSAGNMSCPAVQHALDGSKETYLKVTVGSELTLNCSMSGLHPPTLYWSKLNGCGFEYENIKASVYRQPHAAIGDSGTYICTGSDGSGPNITRYFHVNITALHKEEVCNFDDGTLCGWEQQKNDNFDWTFENGSTQSDGTGPDVDHTLGTVQGKYIYIESSSPRQFGEHASISSHVLPANRTMCFEFWYYMFGDGSGQLFVFIQDTCTTKMETQLLKDAGDKGAQWNKASVTIARDSVPNDYRIVLMADVGATYHGDTAVDDLIIHDGPCQGSHGAPIVG